MGKGVYNACSLREEGEERNYMDLLTAVRSCKNHLVETPVPVN